VKEAHIAWFGFPIIPCINPMLQTVSVLVRRGYRVSYVASPEFSQRIRQTGAEFVPCAAFDFREAIRTFNEGIAAKESYLKTMFDWTNATLKLVTSFYATNRPDILIYDAASLGGLILSRIWNVPAIQISSTFALDRDVFEKQAPHATFRKTWLEIKSGVDEFLRDHGIAHADSGFRKEGLNIYFFPREIQPQKAVFDERCFFAGRCAGEQAHYGEWKSKSPSGMPIILVSSSTTYIQGPEFFKMCIDALSGLGWHIILSIGGANDCSSFGTLPQNFEIVQGISHVRILARVSLFICAGGIISTAEAMYHGVPLLVTSHGSEELEWQGDNIASLGIGIHLREAETTIRNIRKSAVQVISDRKILKKVRQIQSTVQRDPGAEETANRIQEYLEAHLSCNAVQSTHYSGVA
jgi:MGT family glycosyltransferase